jgi:nitroimidazol reductase NimA-like FMN-containing flavoprotein (pyridoxamine 5'-phosphate oxidase superfamily)
MTIKRSRLHTPNLVTDGPPDNEDGMLAWAWVSEQMEKSRNYWLCTTRPDGAPHAAPIWAVWVEETLYFAIGKTSRKGKNIAHDSRVVIHLESGDDTLIFEGTAEEFTDLDVLQAVVDIYAAKYDYKPTIPMAEGEGFFVLRPTKAMAWLESDFEKSAARFTFENDESAS